VVSDENAEYTVITDDEQNYQATVRAVDPSNDIAIIKIEADNLPVVSLGYSDSIQVGQKTVVIGNALGEYSNTATSGIISGVNRTITAGQVGSASYERLEGVIQTDAAINYGNSGGPLIDLAGNVIGVATAVDFQGSLIGFAIPINDVRSAIESYLENGEIVRPLLGVRFVAVTPDFAKLNNLKVDYGALIYSPNSSKMLPVIPGSPADNAGIKEGDIITKINGEEINEDNSLTYLVQKNKPGDEIEVTLARDGEEITKNIKLDTFEQ
jgi:S1-C subfamily serine protease